MNQQKRLKLLSNMLLSKNSYFLFKIMSKNIKTKLKFDKYFQKKLNKYKIDS